MKKILIALAVILLLTGITVILLILRSPYIRTIKAGRNQKVWAFIRHPEEHQDWVMEAGSVCNDAPFLFPSSGFVGYLWDDSFQLTKRHQGIDIFAGTDSGITPVIAAYDGYLTRLVDWKSSVIIRVPQDPLQPDRQIWLYYTHLADSEGNSLIDNSFPPGSSEVMVKAGTQLGYQGNYSGTPGNPVGIHLHFSIVRDDGEGNFLNELHIDNTIDPSPYLGLVLNAEKAGNEIPLCVTTIGE